MDEYGPGVGVGPVFMAIGLAVLLGRRRLSARLQRTRWVGSIYTEAGYLGTMAVVCMLAGGLALLAGLHVLGDPDAG